LSEVEVQTAGGLAPELIAFTSSGGIPHPLEQQLTDQGVTIYQADAILGHAEREAGAYRADVGAQEADLGGPIVNVKQVVVTNTVCSEECAQGLTTYIGKEGVTVSAGDRGYMNGQVLTPEYMSDTRAEFGGVSSIDALMRDYFSDDVAEGDGGMTGGTP
jgi:hypothetical protein